MGASGGRDSRLVRISDIGVWDCGGNDTGCDGGHGDGTVTAENSSGT